MRALVSILCFSLCRWEVTSSRKGDIRTRQGSVKGGGTSPDGNSRFQASNFQENLPVKKKQIISSCLKYELWHGITPRVM
ncbi:hypothetical protein DESPIGER_1694 [Desulfovibrio piger]|uniref:Uncharacterized protein n=1 Tax=Desulfovibrio piger TaxID=901 RepID=A0A1K1LFQ5_9BACT|nr:hypothetical protein DESPIGER_1694 [Desulfovibrio piger]